MQKCKSARVQECKSAKVRVKITVRVNKKKKKRKKKANGMRAVLCLLLKLRAHPHQLHTSCLPPTAFAPAMQPAFAISSEAVLGIHPVKLLPPLLTLRPFVHCTEKLVP